MSEQDRFRRTNGALLNLTQPRHGWYRIVDADDGTDVYLFDEIGGWGVTAQDFINEISPLNGARLRLHLNSPGGEVFQGIAIYNALKQRDGATTGVVDGVAASIASVIAMGCDELAITQNGQMMVHDGIGVCVGNAADMRELATLLDRTSDNIASIYAQKTGGTVDGWRQLMEVETWFGADEAVDVGLADEVLDQVSDRADRSWTSSALSNKAAAVHHTATSEDKWDAGAARRGYPADAATLKAVHAWQDPDGDPDAKSSYKFPHHYDKGGPANLNAVRNGLARLPGAGIDDKDGVEAHLRAHLDDADTGGDNKMSGGLDAGAIARAFEEARTT